jgi:hypothetical protein
MRKSVTIEDVEYFEVERAAQIGDVLRFEHNTTLYLVTKLPKKADDDCLEIVSCPSDGSLVGRVAYAGDLEDSTVYEKPKRAPKTGELIQVVAAEPTESRPYQNGDIFEVGYAWHYEVGGVEGCYGGVTTVQNVELFDREFVLLDTIDPIEVLSTLARDSADRLHAAWTANPHAEVFGAPMGAEFGSDEYEFLSSIGAYPLAPDELCVMPDEPTVEFIGDKVDHPSHYKQGKFETIEVIEEITQGYGDSYVGYCVGNAIKYLARAPHKHDTPEEDLRKAAKYLEFALARFGSSKAE